MKVLVLNPPTKNRRYSRDGRCQNEESAWLDVFPPTTLASIAGIVREKYETKLIDCMGARISFNSCIEQAKQFNPSFTVINTSTPTIINDMEVAKVIKDATNSKIIAYGEHITARYKDILEEFPQVDYAILGEPETPIMSILCGEPKVKGVATRDFEGGIWQEPDLDNLPFPAYDLLPRYNYPLTGERWMWIRRGRGCPYNCTFCVMPLMANRTIKYHSVDYMIKQIKWLINDLGIKLYMFWEETSTFDKKGMLNLCETMVKEGLNKECKWFCTTRVDCFDEELAENMKKAGCRTVALGIESASQEVLNRNKKKITIQQTISAVRAAKKYGLKVAGHFIIGLPGSSPETAKKTIKFAKKLKLHFAQFYAATPFPGSAFYKEAIDNNWFVAKDWSYVEPGTAAISYPDFSITEIRKWKKKAYRNFYLRPYALWSILSSISLKKLLSLPKDIARFFGWMTK